MKKLLLLFILCIFSGLYLYAQEVSEVQEEEEEIFDIEGIVVITDNQGRSQAYKRQDFWLALSGDTAFYAAEGIAYGPSLAFGFGTGTCIGLKAVYFFSTDKVDTIELSFLLRFYLKGANAYNGPYLQLMGGPSFYNRRGEASIPSTLGTVSAGACFGWRFLIKDRFFIEPQVRAGYPYLAGATVSLGIRF